MQKNADGIAAALRQSIAAGEWSDTGRLPTERELADRFGVARNTVRRAFDRLEEAGLLTRHVGRGTYLRSAEAGSLDEIVRRMAGASPADMMELRLLLEPSAAAFAAINASVPQLAAIETAHRHATEALEMPEFERWDTEFHQLICECSRNELLREIHNLLRVLRDQTPWFEMKKRSFSEERRQAYCIEHSRILAALVNRLSEEAECAMRAHLITVQKNILCR